MSARRTFTSARATEPNLDALRLQVRALDVTAGVTHDIGTPTYVVKKETAFTAPQITAAQNTIDTAPANSSTLTAQAVIDHWPPEMIGLIDLLLDEFNILRRLQTPPLADRTRAQVLAGIRGKVGQP